MISSFHLEILSLLVKSEEMKYILNLYHSDI